MAPAAREGSVKRSGGGERGAGARAGGPWPEAASRVWSEARGEKQRGIEGENLAMAGRRTNAKRSPHSPRLSPSPSLDICPLPASSPAPTWILPASYRLVHGSYTASPLLLPGLGPDLAGLSTVFDGCGFRAPVPVRFSLL